MTIRYLSSAEIQGLYDLFMEAAGTEASFLDEGKLEAASLRPQNIVHYSHADLYVQAAALIAGVALAHAYSDGNKRLALLVGDVFLQINGIYIQAERLAFAEQVMDLLNRPIYPGSGDRAFDRMAAGT